MSALPKPAPGTAQKQRRARRRQIESRMLIAKARAKQRDYFRCRRCGAGMFRMEAAHIRDAGMGGDGGRYSSDPRDFVTLCYDCHQGPSSVHSGHVKIVAGDRGGDGVVRFEDVTPRKSLTALLRE